MGVSIHAANLVERAGEERTEYAFVCSCGFEGRWYINRHNAEYDRLGHEKLFNGCDWKSFYGRCQLTVGHPGEHRFPEPGDWDEPDWVRELWDEDE